MFGRSVCVLSLAMAVGACSHAGSITRTSADYNKAMATVRNEQLLLNILRAAAREPLQFSAMGEINTTFDRTAELDLNNLILRGANAMTQVVKLTGDNKPVVKISPLSNREFISGMLRPTTPETLRQFMDLGWDAEFMLPLLVRGYRCPGDSSFIWLAGTDPDLQAKLSRLSGAGSGARWVAASTAGKPVELQVADDKALEMLRSGVAGGYTVDSIRAGAATGTSVVRLVGPGTTTTTLYLPLCGATDPAVAANGGTPPSGLTAFTVGDHKELPHPAAFGAAESARGEIAFRSVEGIIYFLGERLRRCYLDRAGMAGCALIYGTVDTAQAAQADKYLLHISSGAKPAETAVGAQFYGHHYWVSRLDRADSDRTMKTFAFLNQLIALQTESSATGTTQTVLAIGAR